MIAAVILIVAVSILGFVLANYLLKVCLRREYFKAVTAHLHSSDPVDPASLPPCMIHPH